jgi:glycosyltransferase involved in cell wall biosynthesis
MSRPIILVSLVYHPDTSAASILFTDLLGRLASGGVRCTVLTGFPSKDGSDPILDAPRAEVLDGVHVLRCGLRMRGKRNVFTRAVTYGTFLAHAGGVLLRTGRGALVVAGTDPPFAPVAVFLLSTVVRFRFDCLLLDVYPDGLSGLGTLGPRSLLAGLWRGFNRLTFRHARRLIVIGRDMFELVQSHYGADASRIVRIPLWAPRELDAPAEKASHGRKGPTATESTLCRAAPRSSVPPPSLSLRADLGLQNRFIVAYSGNMGLWHDIDTIVRAAACLHSNEGIVFLFVGRGRRRPAAEHLARRLGLHNSVWLDLMPRPRLADPLLACDAALISLCAGLEGVAVPSKLYGILAAGRPVLAQVPVGSEVARVVEEEACGIVTAPGDASALASAIRLLSSDPDLARHMGRRARAAYDAKYTLDRAVNEYLRLWTEL